MHLLNRERIDLFKGSPTRRKQSPVRNLKEAGVLALKIGASR